MSVELGKGAPRPIDFTIDGKKLATRPLPFRLFMELANAEDSEVTTQVMGRILLACVVFEKNGAPAFTDLDQVMDWDGPPLAKLFNEVSRQAAKTETARKNSKASQR